MIRSIQYRLSAWLSVVVILLAVIAGAVTFMTALHEANELQDGQLKQVAALITPHNLDVMERDALANVPGASPRSKLVIQKLSENAPLTLSADLRDGLQTAVVNNVPWRVLITTLATGTRIAIGQKTAGRDDVAHSSALAAVMPFAMLVPVLLVLLHLLVRRMLGPLTLLAVSLDGRPDHDLSPLSQEGVPSEIAPFVVAINRLFGRVEALVASQQRFVADAAHELRSPLTALALQAERLSGSEMSTPARERLNGLRRGLDRTRKLLNQLLTLARLQDKACADPAVLRVHELFRNVLEDLMPLAEAKDIDIGVSSVEDVRVRASEADLTVLIKNLVDNAISYTPKGGCVNLSTSIENARPHIRVEDTGPGIAPEERARVFDPFYRVLGSDTDGSGLGLSIVGAIAARIGATVEFSDAVPNGLVVTVVLPDA
jgi:two-component system OmpR family sensor kinase